MTFTTDLNSFKIDTRQMFDSGQVPKPSLLPPSPLSMNDTSLSFPVEARYGLLGEMLTAIEPQTEADPVGILLGWLCCYGNIIGRTAHFTVGGTKHYPVLYAGIVGNTSDAKGDGWNAVLYPFREIAPDWVKQCVGGIGSGEGLVERICDEQTILQADKKTGEVTPVVLPGAMDKRFLVRLSELSRCFKIGRRESSTLSEFLREAWDCNLLHIANRGGNSLSADAYTITLFGDITPGVLRKILEGGTEAFDGSANRYLWCLVKSQRDLPKPGKWHSLHVLLPRLSEAVAFAKGIGEVERDAEAEAFWESIYGMLKREADTIPHTDRARPHVMRLALLYALLDKSDCIRLPHLKAAMAIWGHCRESARRLFATPNPQRPSGPVIEEPLYVRLSNMILRKPGISRSEIRDLLGTGIRAEEIEAALQWLESKGWAYRQNQSTGGRPAECWYPGVKPGNLLNEDDEMDLLGVEACSTCSTNTNTPSILGNHVEGIEANESKSSSPIPPLGFDPPLTVETQVMGLEPTRPLKPQPSVVFLAQPETGNLATTSEVESEPCPILGKRDEEVECFCDCEVLTPPNHDIEPLAYDPESSPMSLFLVAKTISVEECVARYAADPEIRRREDAYYRAKRAAEEETRRNAPPDPAVAEWLAKQGKRKRR